MSTDVAAAVHRRHALAREFDPLPVPGLACEPAHLERPVPGRLDPTLQDPRCRLRIVLDEVPLERHQGRAFLLRGQPVRKVEPPSVVGLEHDASSYSGMFPCLRAGTDSRFVESMRSALISRGLVSAGSITSSTKPRSAAAYGVENLSRYSRISSARFCPGSSARSISLLNTMLTAPSAPITAISAVGHANETSARRCLEFMTRYAPPYALRVITVMRGTVASAYAYRSFAPWRMIPLYSCAAPGRNPGTSTNVRIGMLNASQNRTNREAFSLASMSSVPARTFGWFATTPTLRPSSRAKPITMLSAHSGKPSRKSPSS